MLRIKPQYIVLQAMLATWKATICLALARSRAWHPAEKKLPADIIKDDSRV
jgi:hypothetical protein